MPSERPSAKSNVTDTLRRLDEIFYSNAFSRTIQSLLELNRRQARWMFCLFTFSCLTSWEPIVNKEQPPTRRDVANVPHQLTSSIAASDCSLVTGGWATTRKLLSAWMNDGLLFLSSPVPQGRVGREDLFQFIQFIQQRERRENQIFIEIE